MFWKYLFGVIFQLHAISLHIYYIESIMVMQKFIIFFFAKRMSNESKRKLFLDKWRSAKIFPVLFQI